jgi:hypothetical protein
VSRILRYFVRLPLGWPLRAPSAILKGLLHDQQYAVMVHERDLDVYEHLSRPQSAIGMMAEIESLELNVYSRIQGSRRMWRTKDSVCQPVGESATRSMARDIGLAADCGQYRPG